APRKRQRPGIFELLGPPDLGETLGVGTRGRAIAADGGMHVEKRAIGIEDESAWHGPTLRMREAMVAQNRACRAAPEAARSKPRPGQESRERPAADVVDAGLGGAGAHDLDQERSRGLPAGKFPNQHAPDGRG